MTWYGFRPNARVVNVVKLQLTRLDPLKPHEYVLRVRLQWRWLWWTRDYYETLTGHLGSNPTAEVEHLLEVRVG